MIVVSVKRFLLILSVCVVSVSFSADDRPSFVTDGVTVDSEAQIIVGEQVVQNRSAAQSEALDVFCARMANASVLERVMQFPLHDMIARCKKDHNYTDEDMELLEKELRRYLYLCVICKHSVGMYSKHVDNLWHTFILFTREYHAFSNLVNGSYIHHNPVRDHERPTTQEQKVNACSDYAQFIRTYEATFGEQIHPIWLLDGVVEQEGLVVEKAEEVV